MKFRILHDDRSSSTHRITKEYRKSDAYKNHLGYIASSSKEENALDIITAFNNNSKGILFDESNKIIMSKLEKLGIKQFNKKENSFTIFDDKDFLFMFFTSGSTGEPIGALKSKQNLLKEVEVLTSLFKEYKIKRVIVTVPFVHIYGILVGLLYPLLNDIDIIIKEHFMPYDLVELIDENSLIVTTPLYIKALNKLEINNHFNNSLFISSTGPLENEISHQFISKFNTNIIQLFGSTETGGIAYKTNDEELWNTLSSVNISINDKNEMKIDSPFVSNILYENGFKYINGTMQTFDYIEKYQNKFKLIGRSSQILKVSGKRYSTIQIENILENTEGIKRSLVFVKNSNKELENEILDITIESDINFSKKEITMLLKNKLSNIKFHISLKIVSKIKVNSIGKKLFIKN